MKYFSWFSLRCRNMMLGIVLGVTVFPVCAAVTELDDELKYIELLQERRMPDIADEVIADAQKRFPASEYPDAGPRFKVVALKGLLSQGKFSDVQKIVDALPDKTGAEFWAMTLAMADAFYAYQQYAEADKRYLEFFKKIEKPSPALVGFYRDSAYRYAQMLLYMNRERDALNAFRYLFKIPLEEDVLRNVQADVAELIIKLEPSTTKKDEKVAMLKEAEGLADKLLWKQDVWFGKAIVMKAHIFLLRGDVKGAQELVENYMPQLKIIHDSLTQEDPSGTLGMLRMSPMPQCRYLLASLLMDEALAETKKEGGGSDDRIKDLLLGERDPQTQKRKGNGAFNHFINVFIRFPESQWAAEAGERSEQIRKLIKDRYKAELKTPVTLDQMAKVRQMQFAGAQLVFRQNQFKEAAAKYIQVLNQFPETPESVFSLGDLAISFIELSDKDADAALMAEMVTGHLSERFAMNAKLMKDAGDQVRRIGEHYGELKMEDKKRETYALFFRDYPEHYAAGQLVMNFGEREFQAKNFVGAAQYYRQLAAIYTNSPYYFDALNRIAQIQKEEGNFPGEIEALEFYVAKLAEKGKPSHALVVGKFRLADAQREYANSILKSAATNMTPEVVVAAQSNAVPWLSRAIIGLGDVVKRLETPGEYQTTAEEKQRNEQVRESATFTRAICLTQLQYPEDKVSAFRKAAIGAFEHYVKLYPKGKWAPKAQLQVGTLHTILQDAANAQAAFDKLSKEYPDSDEAKNSVPMLAASLIEMGLRGEGVAKYRQMFAGGGKYTDGQFMAAAQALEGAKEHDLALQAYDRVIAMAKDPTLIALAKLGRARTLTGQKKYVEAHKLLSEFIKQYAKLQVVVDANLLLVEVASEEGKVEKDDRERTLLFNAAIDALKMVKRYRPDEVQQKELDLAAGEILIRKMDAEKKLGLNEKAAETRGKAIVVFQGLVASINPGNAKLSAVLEKAYFYCLPLMLEHKAYKEVSEDCETYLRMFPTGRYRTDVQNWMNQAKIGQ